MGAKVAFCWTPKLARFIPWLAFRDYHRETLKAFGADGYIVVNFTNDTLQLSSEEGKYTAEEIKDVSGLAGRGLLVACRPNSGCPLPMFEHPEDCMYVFGPDCGDVDVIMPGNMELQIPTPVSYSLWSPVASGIILHDRSCN